METFEAWLEKIDNMDHRLKMQQVFEWVEDTFPQLGKTVKWNQPMFTDHGTFIIGFSISKNHFSVGLEKEVIDEMQEMLEERGTDFTKMTIRVKWNEEVDFDLLEKIIAFQIEDKEACETFWRK